MELTYHHDPANAAPEARQVRFHELGDVCISQSRQAEPAGPETPQRVTVTLRVRVEIFCGNYGEGYAKVKAIQEAVKVQNAVLEWRNPADPNPVYLNQTVVAASCEAPEEWGTYHPIPSWRPGRSSCEAPEEWGTYHRVGCVRCHRRCCEAPEEWGTYHQIVNVTFVYVEALTSAQAGNMAATLAYGSPPTTVTRGKVSP